MPARGERRYVFIVNHVCVEIRIRLHQHPARAPGGLQEPFPVDEVGFTGLTHADTLDKPVEGKCVDGRAQIPGSIAFMSADGDNEMRDLAIPQEHVRDVETLFPHGLEPLGLGVVLACQFEGSDVLQVVSCCVEDPKVDKRFRSGLQITEKLRQVGLVGNLFHAAGGGGEPEIGCPLVEEFIHHVAMVGRRTHQRCFHLVA